jgi:hypothetical protein
MMQDDKTTVKELVSALRATGDFVSKFTALKLKAVSLSAQLTARRDTAGRWKILGLDLTTLFGVMRRLCRWSHTADSVAKRVRNRDELKVHTCTNIYYIHMHL